MTTRQISETPGGGTGRMSVREGVWIKEGVRERHSVLMYITRKYKTL